MAGYTDFDTWFSEQEGFSIRAERFDGDVEWLRAAFEAGRSASPAPPEGGEPVAWAGWERDFSKVPRDGREVKLWNGRASSRLRWSTHYSIHGLGGCWTDGFCTMSDHDFIAWSDPSPSPDTGALREAASEAYRACMSAWSCGEPAHRVKTMLDAVERLGSVLGEPGAPTLNSTKG